MAENPRYDATQQEHGWKHALMSSSESLLNPGFCDKPEVSSRLPIGDGEPVDIAETRHRPELAWLQDRLAYHPRSDMDMYIYIYMYIYSIYSIV